MKNVFLIIGFVLLFVFTQGCHDNPTDSPIGNKAPDTHLSLFPDAGIKQQPSRLTVSWWGDDPDGLVIGYYFKWSGQNWEFTTTNDSLFALQIGATDTTYTFEVVSVDNSGNTIYDNQIVRNGIDFGAEPYVDENQNGQYDEGEPYTDIGLIDPTPAKIDFPIVNSTPEIRWDDFTVLPDTTLPVLTLGWDATDNDGEETIKQIHLYANDTTNENYHVALNPGTDLITIRIRDFSSDNPSAEILVDGAEFNIFDESLNGLVLNGNNKIYLQVEDISGAKSPFITIPSEEKTCYIKKPTGNVLVIDDYLLADKSESFYKRTFDELEVGGSTLTGKYDTWNIAGNEDAYFTYNFLLTLKLYDYVFWYTDGDPSVELAASSVNKYLEQGGKIFFSMLLHATEQLSTVQEFLPVESMTAPIRFLNPNTEILPDSSLSDNLQYPTLQTSESVAIVRGFFPSVTGIPVYKVNGNRPEGNIAFYNNAKTLFYFGLPLSKCAGNESGVNDLLKKVFVETFGLTQ